jgi:hypothetical protein
MVCSECKLKFPHNAESPSVSCIAARVAVTVLAMVIAATSIPHCGNPADRNKSPHCTQLLTTQKSVLSMCARGISTPLAASHYRTQNSWLWSERRGFQGASGSATGRISTHPEVVLN